LLIAITSTFIVGTTTPVYAASGYTWNNVKIVGGGFIPGIIFNTKQKDLIYARTDIGGAYRWNPTTSSWVSISDSVGFVDWNKNGVDALATDPVDPNRVYMATGTYTNEWDTNGQIMRSTDQGNTWQVTTLPFKVGGNMPGRSMGERLVIDPNKNSTLYFGARSGNGLWKSTDYGVTWAKVTSFTNTGTYIQNPGQAYGSDTIGISWITFNPSTGSSGSATQTIYIGVADTGNSVYRSTDGGATWSAVPGQPTGFLPHHGVLSSTGILYISYSNGVGPYDGSSGDVWKLDTATGTWTKISPVPSTDTSNDYYGYGGLAVDAQHPNTLMVATLNSWWPDAIIYRSTDAGATWTRIWDWNGYPSTTLHYTQDISAAPWLTMGIAASPPTPSPKLGWMIGDLEIDPFNSDRMMYGTGATLYGTNNLTTWDSGGKINISVMAQGIEETAVCSLISPPSGANLLSGLGDIGGFRHDDLTKVPTTMYTQPVFVTTLGMDYAENNPSFIVRVGNVDKSNNTTIHSSAFSYDGGTSWFQGNSEPTGITGGGSVAAAADGSVVVWSPQGTTSVYYSKDNGNSWTPSTGIPAGANVASDRVNSKKFYGFLAGSFYVSNDGGATFTKTAATGLPTNMVGGVAVNESKIDVKAMPGHEGDIWCAGGNSTEGIYGIWHSTDSGASFTKLTNVQEADVIGFGMAAPGQSYMALYSSAKVNGIRGIFRSDDAGTTWVRINDDQHQYARINMCITGDPRIYGRVYVGTNGRGIVYGDISSTVKNSTISPTTASFDKNTTKQTDIPVTLTLNGNTLSGIYNSSTALVSGTDYTVSGTTVTILKSYMAKQAAGTTSLTFQFSAGTNPVLTVTVSDSTASASISPATASYDKNTSKQADIPVTITLNGNTLTGIYNGSTALVSGTDYTVSGTTVTILKSYLAKQAVGTTNLIFQFSAGTNPTLNIIVSDSTVQTGNIKVQMYNGTTTASINTINPKFKLVNTGSSAITLSNVKLRYYYTIDTEKTQNFFCDWSTIGNTNVTGTFTKMATAKTGADYYVEIAFTSGAGSLAAGQSIEVQTRLTKTDWTNYTQTGDYSFDSIDTTYVDWSKVTGYISGSLQWGTEP
jgi:hypothetical protein